MSKATIDFAADAFQEVPADKLTIIRGLAEEMRVIESRLEKWATEAKKLQQRYNDISGNHLPELMKEVGMSEFKLANGDIISVGDFVSASIPSKSAIDDADADNRPLLEDRRKRAIAWLTKSGGAALIKTAIKATFGKGQSKAATKFYKEISKAGFEATLDESVHPQTLNKFIKECIAEGIDVPQEPFNLYTGRKAVIARKKAAK
jgi:hypothetical protein